MKNKEILNWLRGAGNDKRIYRSLIAILCFALFLNAQDIHSQGKTITGTVVDNSGGPLPGVSIIIEGTATGVQTDFDGKFSITASTGDVLIFSYVGLKTVNITVGTNLNVDVTLEDDASVLDEVVVVGYGTKKRINLTGAVSTVGAEEIEDRPVANIQQALQGTVPNLAITTSGATGEPGAEMAMSIRGLTSIEGNSSPYVLIDGIPMGMNDIDPNDVESISVLKDVASTAIYGARAAYGVILITTKIRKR